MQLKVKDIKEFRKWLKRQERMNDRDENFIGYSNTGKSSDDPNEVRGFFNVFHASSPDIENRLSTVLDMAQDSQAIYEFVQNAVDCNSTAYFMFYEDNHFIVINNGDPFTLEGIRAILNFAQSTKVRDENIGKFGVGFKLIHRMVGTGNGLQELTKDFTGPILYSWSSKEQLLSLINSESTEDIKTVKDEDWNNSDAAWFFKILLTCVPVLPNNIDNGLRDIEYKERNDLFTDEEFDSFKEFLNSVWENNQDKFANEDLNQGSLFYLKLGTDKEKKLDEDFEYFKKGIQYSLSFVSNLMDKKGLQRIYFKDEDPIEKENIDVYLEPPFIIQTTTDEFQEIKEKLKENDKNRNINIVFGFQPFENSETYGNLRQSPNFYKFFPMGKEICGLNFIVHSNIFEIEASRREFVQKDKRNIYTLEKAAQKLQLRLDNYQNTSTEVYDNIFLSILFSNEPNKQEEWITQALLTPLQTYITKNCPTANDNGYQHASNVILRDTALEIQPSDFGIANKFWFKWSKDDFSEIKKVDGKRDDSYSKIIKSTWNIIDLIKEGNINQIKAWYNSLKTSTKQIFHDELLENWKYVSEAKFWTKIIEIPELIEQVIQSEDLRVKSNYAKNIASLKLSTNGKYSQGDYEYKLLKIARETLTSTSDIEVFRTKVFIIDALAKEHRLNDTRENDKIKFDNNNGKDKEINLSDVLPSYESRSGLLRPIIRTFESLDLQLHSFFGVGKQKPADEIYKLLLINYQKLVNAYQFVFLGLYSTEKNKDFFGSFDLTKLKAADILDLYFKEKHPFPKKYAKYIDGFEPNLSVYPNEWAIESERLPLTIRKWIESDSTDDKISFLANKEIGINNEESNLVKIRKSFKGDTEITQQHINLVVEKSESLILNTLFWLKQESVVIKDQSQVTSVKKILKSLYEKIDYDTDHPQLYIHKIKNGDLIEYKFLENNESDFLINDSIIKEIYKHDISLKQIFEIAQKSEKPIFDSRNYPENEINETNWEKISIVENPDFDKILNSSWSFDEAFFQEWLDSNNLQILFYQGKMPYIVKFESEILKEITKGNFCKNEDTGEIFINLNQSLSNSEKAEIIVENLKSLPEDILDYHQKNSLDIAYKRWKDGEIFHIGKIRKDKIKESEEYSFEWLKAIFDWEFDATVGSVRAYTLKFDKVSLNDNFIVLGECSFETIPSRVEFMPDLIELRLTNKRDVRKVVSSISNYNEFDLTLMPENPADLEFLKGFNSLSNFKASFRLPGEDVLMDRLRENLFGAAGLAPKTGDLRDYLQEHFSTEKISFLFGPPGTGKTTKLALDILTTLSFNNFFNVATKILVLTPTNKAADVLIERILELLFSDQKLNEVASTYYSADSVSKLQSYCNSIKENDNFKRIFVRYGNSASAILQENAMLHSRFTLKEIWPNLVLATTVHRLAFDELAGNQLKDIGIGWTHIVIDEASMISLPHAVYTLLQFADVPEVSNKAGLLTTFTISGDPFQIQPVGQTPSYIDQGIDGLKGWATENIYTLFELTNFSLNRTPVGNHMIRKLLTQYRSVPAIGELFSKYKYDGRINHQKQRNTKEIEFGETHLENINLFTFPVYAENQENQEKMFNIQKYGEFSAYHIYSVVFSSELASAIKLQNPNKSVGVITPYGTQARLLKEISYSFINQNIQNDFNVSTIHRYQGDESDVIILVMNPPKMNPWEFSHFNNSFLINVGISRAKESLIILHPHNIDGYSEITDGVLPLCKDLNNVFCGSIEEVLLEGLKKNEQINHFTDLIEVKDFSTFNVCDLREFTHSGKEYLFFADTRELNENEKRYANVIVNISKRLPIIKYVEPKENLLVTGIITGIHQNNRTAFVKLKNIKERGVIHNNAVSNQFVSDINQVLKINQPVTARILSVNDKGVSLTMKGIKQELK